MVRGYGTSSRFRAQRASLVRTGPTLVAEALLVGPLGVEPRPCASFEEVASANWAKGLLFSVKPTTFPEMVRDAGVEPTCLRDRVTTCFPSTRGIPLVGCGGGF